MANLSISIPIENTLVHLPGYFEKTCQQRLPGGAGSILEGDYHSWQDVRHALESSRWENYSHPAIDSHCRAFITHDLCGRLGVVALKTLPSDALVTLDDRKGTGLISATVSGVLGPRVDFVVLITGTERDREVVFTFHPGEPVLPSRVQTQPGMHGRKITVLEALHMGLTSAKIVE